MQEINFKVLEIKRGEKSGIVGVDVQFDNSDKVYSYWRGIGVYEGRTYALISGCKVFFDDDLKVTSIEREYDVEDNDPIQSLREEEVGLEKLLHLRKLKKRSKIFQSFLTLNYLRLSQKKLKRFLKSLRLKKSLR